MVELKKKATEIIRNMEDGYISAVQHTALSNKKAAKPKLKKTMGDSSSSRPVMSINLIVSRFNYYLTWIMKHDSAKFVAKEGN